MLRVTAGSSQAVARNAGRKTSAFVANLDNGPRICELAARVLEIVKQDCPVYHEMLVAYMHYPTLVAAALSVNHSLGVFRRYLEAAIQRARVLADDDPEIQRLLMEVGE